MGHLADLPGQPAAHRRQHPAASPPAGHRRGAGRQRSAAGPGQLRDLRPQARRVLRRAGQIHSRLLLHRTRYRLDRRTRGLGTERETALGQLADAGAELPRREQARPKTLTAAERAAILSLGDNLEQVWTAPTTTDKDRKQLLRTLLEEVTVNVHRDDTE